MLLDIPGRLVMDEAAPILTETAAAWSAIPLNRWLMVAATVIFLVNVPNLYKVIPQLVKCLYAWRRNILIEDSVSLTRARSYSCTAMFLPVSLMISRFRLFGDKLLDLFTPETLSLGAMAFAAAFAVLRYLIYGILGLRVRHRGTWKLAHAADSNYFLLLCGLLLPTVGLLLLFNANDAAVKAVLIVECAVFYLIFLIRKFQIFSSEFRHFATFLYLCALECLPLGIFIWSCL